MTPILKFQLHFPGMKSPVKAHHNDSGIDLTLMAVEKKRPSVFFFNTGVSIEPPEGFYCELYPRSSVYKTDFIMQNSVGVIDSGYRGILYMPMRYIGSGNGLQEANKLIGQRVGQLILRRLESFNIEVVNELSSSERGNGGFGSSGIN